ncbi:MAG: hypothetical protein Q4F79_07795 [Eubacteriales bacterium]|nr:hypothetical protein [Eubacteriales bacterium]
MQFRFLLRQNWNDPMRRNEWLHIHPSFFVFWTVTCLLDADGYLWQFVLAAGIHEMGHAAAVFLAGGRIDQLVLYAAGACMQVHHPRGYWCDIAIAAAGPLAGFAAAIVSAGWGNLSFAGVNLLLSLFNCLPVLPLDGGCIVAYLLCLSPAGLRGYDFLCWVSLAESAGLIALGFYVWCRTGTNLALLVIGIILFVGNCGRQRMHEKAT